MSCLLFDGMFGLHIQLSGHLITVISKQVIIQRFVVSRNGTSDRRSMGRKDRRNFRYSRLQIKRS